MYCVETNNLTHRFSEKETVLDQINLQVPTGSIYGFLGPNGAGKTTSLKLLLGLIKKQQGSITVFGQSFDQNRQSILQKTGSLIESPSLYAHLTASENLLVLQKIYQCPKARIAEVLQLVGLADTGSKKAGKFSLGMKQRLSIAIALLNNPRLLILDEPTNGLDPNGIIEMRELLKRLNLEQGITIIISSHLLSEIEKLVTHTGIIHKGKMMFQGTLQQLQDKQLQGSFVLLDTSDHIKTLRIMRDNNIEATTQQNKIMVPILPKKQIAEINKLLIRNEIDVYELSTIKNDLESIFMGMVK